MVSQKDDSQGASSSCLTDSRSCLHPCCSESTVPLDVWAAAYARVDLLRGDDGALKVIELELIEPALFLHCAAGASGSFAKALLPSLSN